MKKDLLILCIIVLIIAFVASGTKIQSVDDYYLTHRDDIFEDSETVFLSIECGTVLDNWSDLKPSLRDERYVPSSGFILTKTEFVLHKGDTVFDILDRAIRKNRIHMECVYSVQYSSVYVKGINQLYEFSCGSLSGWMYCVNGVFPNYGCSAYKPKDRDVIEWKYTCDLGRDLGADMESLGEKTSCFFEHKRGKALRLSFIKPTGGILAGKACGSLATSATTGKRIWQ